MIQVIIFFTVLDEQLDELMNNNADWFISYFFLGVIKRNC